MAGRTAQRKAAAERRQREATMRQAQDVKALRNRVLLALGAAVAIVVAVFLIARGGSSGGKYTYAVGSPATGQPAPAIDLPSTDGGTFHLAAQRGKTVMLYFQEGLTCEPCWTQLKDLDRQQARLHALGIDEVVSITSDPLSDLRTKVSDERISSPVLSDASLTVSSSYSANDYGMMGASRDGHSFVVVGPDGRIRWRADYGGAPNYTMYVPVSTLLAQMRKALSGSA